MLFLLLLILFLILIFILILIFFLFDRVHREYPCVWAFLAAPLIRCTWDI